ncbi:MAG TPA: Na+/H+ antiporter subunit E [Candidatus Hydrogenedentes bacterium]|nr:Na+/H+ antiporter subunit E [Candidatus Hydrogenedentota bacterium]
MILFLWNILLALLWGALTGVMTPLNLMAGFALAYAALSLTRAGSESGYFRRTRRLLQFLPWFLWQMVVSNLRVAYDVITPWHTSKPGVVAVPLDAETDLEITLLANLITLTPGTLTLDVSEDRKTLYLHAMFITDPEDVRREIKDGLERRLLELLR